MKIAIATCTVCLWQHRCLGESCSELRRHDGVHKQKDAVRYAAGEFTGRHETMLQWGTVTVEGVPLSNTKPSGSSTTPRPARQPSGSKRP